MRPPDVTIGMIMATSARVLNELAAGNIDKSTAESTQYFECLLATLWLAVKLAGLLCQSEENVNIVSKAAAMIFVGAEPWAVVREMYLHYRSQGVRPVFLSAN